MADQPIMDLLAAVREHLTTHDLPRVITLSASPSRHVTMGIAHPESLAGLAAELLSWADTLTTARGFVWRTHSGESIHLEIHGALKNGVEVTLFGGASAPAEGFGAGLAPNEKDIVPMRVLRDLAGGAT